MDQFDAVLVPGGGVRSDGSPPPWVRNRLDRAIDRRQDGLIITLSAGTVHKPPPLDSEGFPLLESVCGARYLVGRGVPENRVLFETSSYDTIGNAYFARMVHTDPARLRRLLVVTSEFHMGRTREIFEWVFGLSPDGYRLEFESVPDAGMSPDTLAARKQKERAALDNLRELRATIRTLCEMHHWIFQSHSAYAVWRPAADVGPAAQSY